jgi:hypothetical protein
LFFLAIAPASAVASVPNDDERLFSGPMHYCGTAFAIELAAEETIAWRNPVHDFDLHRLQSSGGGFGIYEGNHPQTFENEREEVELPSVGTIERLKHPETGYSYLIATNRQWPRYIHLYGQVWQGTEADYPLVSRLNAGSPDAIGCPVATARQQTDHQ